MDAINIDSMSKSYDGTTNALDNINLNIPKGEVFGFLGPNGSGKTTMVRILNGILSPTGGNASILGKDVAKDSIDIHKLCGVMTETAACYENLSAEDNLLFFGRMHDMDERELKKRVEYILKKLELYEVRERKVKKFSTGMRKRVSLAIALIHNPQILFLDEPTSGLDPENALNVTKLIQELAEENKVTVFLCTHQLKYAQDICTLYGFINNGTLLGFGTFDELAARKNANLFLKLRGIGVPDNLGFNYEGNNVYKRSISGDEDASELIHKVLKGGGRVFEAVHEKWNLEELYFSYIKGNQAVMEANRNE
jgi:ABC-2 type transport system ATP-binding protein